MIKQMHSEYYSLYNSHNELKGIKDSLELENQTLKVNSEKQQKKWDESSKLESVLNQSIEKNRELEDLCAQTVAKKLKLQDQLDKIKDELNSNKEELSNHQNTVQTKDSQLMIQLDKIDKLNEENTSLKDNISLINEENNNLNFMINRLMYEIKTNYTPTHDISDGEVNRFKKRKRNIDSVNQQETGITT